MKLPAFRKIFCCLLTLFVLMGCADPTDRSSGAESPARSETADGFSPETDDYAEIGFDLNSAYVTTPDGTGLYWERDDRGLPSMPPKGTIEIYEYEFWEADTACHMKVPYSETFSASTKGTKNRFSVVFYQKGKRKSRIFAYGAPNGAIRIHDNNSVELMGDNSEVLVSFEISAAENEKDSQDRYVSYELEGSGDSYIRLSLADDEILAEGMTGDYTVTKTEHPGQDSLGNRVYLKKYNQYGTEIE